MLAYAQDDLYYYLVIAKNLLAGLGSTFDGTTFTNGYHPLYFLLLLGVTKINASLRSIYTALWLLDVASAVVIFTAARRLLSRYSSNVWICNAFALGLVCLCCWRIIQQMEVTLCLPLGLLLFVLSDRPPQQMTPSRWFGIGLLASVLILSRLDAALLVLLWMAAILGQPVYRRELTPAKLGFFLLAFLPLLLIYLGINHHYFHRFTPVSGAAKQARAGLGIYLPAVRQSFSRGAKLMFLLSACAIAGLPFFWRRLSPQRRVISVSGLLFPFLHYALNILLSDWMIFPWYRYSLIFSMTVVCLLTSIWISTGIPARLQTGFGVVLLLAAAAALVDVRNVPDYVMSDLADDAFFIQKFAQTHPGRYAIGDRAGMVGYIDGQPTVQLEGLVMDDAFLQHIRRQEPLRQVLRQYHVDYYVGFEWSQPVNWPVPGCFHAKEPNHAGPNSPVMRDDFCEAPTAEYMRPTGRTLIFDVRPGR